MTEIELRGIEILNFLVQQPFINCVPISRNFAILSTKPGIYAVRHRSELEGIILVWSKPPFNVRIPMRDL
jgi:hypothetical protein